MITAYAVSNAFLAKGINLWYLKVIVFKVYALPKSGTVFGRRPQVSQTGKIHIL